MKPEELQLIKDVISQVGTAGTATLEAYTQWHLAAALTWLVTGVALLALSIFMAWRTVKDIRSENDDMIGAWIGISLIALLLGLLMVGTNIADVIAPEAAAIHQLLRDVRG